MLPVEYTGIVTRGIAFAIDALMIQLVAIAVAGTAALILSVLSPSNNVNTVIAAIGGVAYVLWLVGYFVVFWSTTGQTPGNRLLEIRVCREADGEPVRPATAYSGSSRSCWLHCRFSWGSSRSCWTTAVAD